MLSKDEFQKMLEHHKKLKWQYFEKLVAFIFEKNDFIAKGTVHKSEKTKMQFDVIAERFDKVFVIECKKWKGNRSSAIKSAAKKHKKKCAALGKTIQGKSLIPIIVTLFQEDIVTESEVLVVPVEKLNFFINSFEELEIE